MKRLITFQTAGRLTLVLFGLVFLFHAAVVIGILFLNYAPVEFLWGGRMETPEELLIFELISMAIIASCLVVVMIRTGILHASGMMRVSRVAMWLFFVLFLLNTAGNIVAKTAFEQTFAFATALLAFLTLRLALEPLGKEKQEVKP